VKVVSKVVPKNVTIGDPVRYSLEVSAPADFETEMPDLSKAFKDLTVKNFHRSQRSFWGTTTIREEYIVAGYVPGNFTVLKQPIKYKNNGASDWQQVLSDEQAFVITSALQGNSTAVLRDIKGSVWYVPWYWIVVLVMVIAIVAGFVFLKWRKRMVSRDSVVAKRPEHEIALEQLDGLQRKDLIGQGKWKEYYSELSDIVRHYLENRFEFDAPEMTTEEFLIYVRDTSVLIAEYKSLLRDFLTASDLVKFAKYVPEASEGNQAFETAKQFVEQTKIVTE
jgi:hypothetical protein